MSRPRRDELCKGNKNKWFRGRVARLSSAKAPTAVRIRSEPLNVNLKGLTFFLPTKTEDMKTLFITLVLLSISLLGIAQIQPYTFTVSTNFSYDRTNFEVTNAVTPGDYKTKQLRIEPKVGFFVSKRFSVGSSFSYVWSNTSGSLIGGQDITNKSIGQGVFVKYYQPIVENFYVIAGLDFSWIKQWNEYTSFDPFSGSSVTFEEEVTHSMLQRGLGLAYFIKRNISIELMGEYFTKVNGDKALFISPENRLLFSLGFQIYLFERSE